MAVLLKSDNNPLKAVIREKYYPGVNLAQSPAWTNHLFPYPSKFNLYKTTFNQVVSSSGEWTTFGDKSLFNNPR